MKLLHVFSVFATPSSFFDGQFRYLHGEGYDIHLICSDDSGAEAFCERNCVHFKPVGIPRAVSPLADLKAIFAVRKYIRENGIEAVFGHTPKGAMLAMTAAFLAGVRHRIYYRHGIVYVTAGGLKRFVLKLEERYVSLLATKIVNVSHSLSRLAVRDHLNRSSKQYVIGSGSCGGVDAENVFNQALIDNNRLVELKQKLGLVGADMIFGFCGRICRDKGIPELVDGFELFRHSHPEVKAKLVLIGDRDIRDGVAEQLARRIDGNRDIVLTGQVRKGDIPYYYSLLDVFILPTRREGFPISVLEASAMGKPVLVTKAVGSEDSIIENKTGIYISLDAAGISEGMERMLDAELRNRLGKAGRKMVLNHYDFRVMWPMIGELYKELRN